MISTDFMLGCLCGACVMAAGCIGIALAMSCRPAVIVRAVPLLLPVGAPASVGSVLGEAAKNVNAANN